MSADAGLKPKATLDVNEYLQLVKTKLSKAVGASMPDDDESKAFVERYPSLLSASKQTEESSRSAEIAVKWEESK